MATGRKKRNTIEKLKDDSGVSRIWGNGLEEVIGDYFRKLFSTTGCMVGEVVDGISGRLDKDHQKFLDGPFGSEEVKEALFDMNPFIAPGIDGFNLMFFQKHWHIIGPEITNICLQVLNGGDFPADWNETIIVLIPKVGSPSSMGDFRPISLCKVIYKIISKAIANRLKKVLGSLISENQSVFVPGRLISDNVITAFEIQHSMKRKRQGDVGWVALKLDMSKVYDRVEWEYV